MATIQSLSEAVGVLKRNPVVFAAGLLYAVVVLPQTALSTLGVRYIPTLVQMVTFFITPFIVAGIFGMVYEGRVRRTGLGTFAKIGKKKYLSILAGNFVIFLITLAFTIMIIVLVLILGLSVIAAAASGEATVLGGASIVSILVFFAAFLLFLVIMLFLQFFGPAVVVDNVGIIEGFQRSVGVVKRNIIPTLGFGVLNLVITVALALPAITLVVLPALTGASTGAPGAASELQSVSYASASILTKVGVIVYSFVISILMTPFRAAFAVSFYDNHRPSHWN